MDPITAPNQPRGAQSGETGTNYALTAGPVKATQRPGGIPGSTTGAEGDAGRDGLAELLPSGMRLPPHTGY